MSTIELELTYLAKQLPEDLFSFPSKEICDIYIPETADHSRLRLRQKGGTYEITKKAPVDKDVSKQVESTIQLTKEEFDLLSCVSAKAVRKIRYEYPVGENMSEIDVFKDSLEGLVLIDFEFKTEEEKSTFIPPSFCLVEITKELFVAGGYLAGKSYEDIRKNLNNFGYVKM